MSLSAKLTDAQLEEAKELKANGITWEAIGRHFGVKGETVRRPLDPPWAAHRREMNNAARRRNKPRKNGPTVTLRSISPIYRGGRPTEAEYLIAKAQIPQDTRDVTAILMGDPIPNDPRRPHLLR